MIDAAMVHVLAPADAATGQRHYSDKAPIKMRSIIFIMGEYRRRRLKLSAAVSGSRYHEELSISTRERNLLPSCWSGGTSIAHVAQSIAFHVAGLQPIARATSRRALLDREYRGAITRFGMNMKNYRHIMPKSKGLRS